MNSELRLKCPARLDRASPMRHALDAFLVALEIDDQLREDILTAVSEALANAVEHAYIAEPAQVGGSVEVHARMQSGDTLLVDVTDAGRFVNRARTPNRGFGLRIIRAIARTVTVDTTGGTRIHMIFDAVRHEPVTP